MSTLMCGTYRVWLKVELITVVTITVEKKKLASYGWNYKQSTTFDKQNG